MRLAFHRILDNKREVKSRLVYSTFYMKKILTVLLTLCLMGGCTSEKSNDQKFSKSFSNVFNTIFTVIMYEESESTFNDNFKFVQEQFTFYNQLFDKYNDYEGINNIKTINDNAGKEAVVVDEDLFNLIKTAMNYNKTISSETNIAMGSVLNIWHNYRELDNGSIPTMDELNLVNEHTNIDNIILDETNKSVYLSDDKMSIDVGAIAKGYACELVKDQLIEKGIDDFLISAGGNVISHGKRGVANQKSALSDKLPASLDYYTVEIQSPKMGDAYENVFQIMAIALQNGESVVTSGDYERYFVGSDGVIYHHLIDGKTLFPANHVRSVSVITEDSGLADFLSTTLFLMDEEAGLELVQTIDEKVDVVWLTNDGRIIYTNGLVEGENCTTSW